MRRELRELRLEVDALREAIGAQAVDRRVCSRQLRDEHVAYDVNLPSRAATSIRLLWADRDKIVTLEDLSFFARDEIAGLDQVGPGSMAKLDKALGDAGLSWPEEGEGR